MNVKAENDNIVGPNERLIMIVGNFGSGKTEVSVNLALDLARRGLNVQIADLDIVNPYFRCREARGLMERHGIRVVVPPGAQAFADLPIILPEISGMLRPPEGTVTLFDVGGDDVGARALGSFRTAVGDGPYQLWQVINSRRPFTDNEKGCLAMRSSLEQASRFEITGLFANSHLIDETTPDTVLEGWALARDVSRLSGLPVRGVAAMERIVDAPELDAIDAPLLRLRRYMAPPWQPIDTADSETIDETDGIPAARPVPLGRPGRIRMK